MLYFKLSEIVEYFASISEPTKRERDKLKILSSNLANMGDVTVHKNKHMRSFQSNSYAMFHGKSKRATANLFEFFNRCAQIEKRMSGVDLYHH